MNNVRHKGILWDRQRYSFVYEIIMKKDSLRIHNSL